MMGDVLAVTSDGLNLRELPEPGAAILATLPKKHPVRRLDDRTWNTDWLRVETEHEGRRYNGYVHGRHVAAATGGPRTSPAVFDAATISRRMLDSLRGYGRRKMIMMISETRKRRVAEVAPILATHFPQSGIDTPRRLAHFIAQTAAETEYYGKLVEGGSESRFAVYEGKLGNREPGDGARFKGRGLIQLTGRTNYTRASEGLGLGDRLVQHPDQVASDPEICVRTALWYWTHGTSQDINVVCERPGTLESVALAVSRAVNLGDADKAGRLNGWESRHTMTQAAYEACGVVTS